MKSLIDRYVIRVTYNMSTFNRDIKNISYENRVGYVSAISQSTMYSDTSFKPEASIALYTEKGAKRAASALRQSWIVTIECHLFYKKSYPMDYKDNLPPNAKPEDHIPTIVIIPIMDALK